ncbi:DUF1214 domain-containing protein [Agaribacterium sp. ZY112]|uniref:DUF1214 domain-containing protein n=1 Tax=Agaribacterium sp. ZY112 TaxID=3233574 RepID=UPI0035252545
MIVTIKKLGSSIAVVASMFLVGAAYAAPESKTKDVNIDNFIRAESDTMLRASLETTRNLLGTQLGELGHLREPFPIENQPVIRMNRDTLYSSAVLDLSKPVSITLADNGGRYQSMHVVNQDHYMFAKSKPGTYTLTQEELGSRYVLVAIRTLANSDDPEDIKLANKAQDNVVLSGGVVGGKIDAPNWNQNQLAEIRQLINQLSLYGLDSSKGFGSKQNVDPIHYFLGSGSGWGGLPKQEAIYDLGQVKLNDGTAHKVMMKDVPVDAFWSITVYNKNGYISPNSQGVYSFNNLTAKNNKDGSVTIHFGACDDNRINCLPISDGWNYAFRYYQPQEELLSGRWSTPEITIKK